MHKQTDRRKASIAHRRSVLERIAEELKKVTKTPDGEPFLRRKGYEAMPISDGNFTKLDADSSGQKLAFVDGGNLEIIGAANFSLSLVRVCSVVLSGIKTKRKRAEFYILSHLDSDNKFHTQLFSGYNTGINADDLIIEQDDKTLRKGMFDVEVSSLGDLARRFAEWKACEQLASTLDQGDIIVLDGTLEANYTNEKKYAKNSMKEAEKSDVMLTALAKTTSLQTTTGNSLLAVLKKRGDAVFPGERWMYYPIFHIKNEHHMAEMMVVKLHPDAGYVFRFEVAKGQYEPEKVHRTLSKLSQNSKDARFLGYPYGLIEADRFARVRKAEAEYQKILFMTQHKDLYKELCRFTSTKDAHGRLDILNH
jgi:hypothetical protein